MDGVDPLPDQDPTEGPNGDESARPGVQPEAGAEYLRNAEADCVHERLGPSRPKSNPALSLATPSRSPAGYTRERLTTRFHTASTHSCQGRFSVRMTACPGVQSFVAPTTSSTGQRERAFGDEHPRCQPFVDRTAAFK